MRGSVCDVCMATGTLTVASYVFKAAQGRVRMDICTAHRGHPELRDPTKALDIAVAAETKWNTLMREAQGKPPRVQSRPQRCVHDADTLTCPRCNTVGQAGGR